MAKQLGERLGLGEYFNYEDYTEVLDWQLQKVGSSLDEMQKDRHKEVRPEIRRTCTFSRAKILLLIPIQGK